MHSNKHVQGTKTVFSTTGCLIVFVSGSVFHILLRRYTSVFLFVVLFCWPPLLWASNNDWTPLFAVSGVAHVENLSTKNSVESDLTEVGSLTVSTLAQTESAPSMLENPQPGSFQSGIGLISGWSCNAQRIDIELDGRVTLQAAYGTSRQDTVTACGDADNGFGLLVNWNLLGDGSHTLRALKDGVEFVRVTFIVTTLGLGEFPQGLTGAFMLQDFPRTGMNARLQWQESLQSFALTNAAGVSSSGGSTGVPGSQLENPQPGSFQSGIGVISGWSCNAHRIDIEIDGRVTLQAAYGTSRQDTVTACGDADNGFGLLVNWNLLGDGAHTLRVLRDGVEVAQVTFTVATLGLGEFPRGLSGSFTLQDFPQPGTNIVVQWQESTQNFVITSRESNSTGCANIDGLWQASEQVTAKCTIAGESETLEMEGEGTVDIVQTVCQIRWEIPQTNAARTGTVTGNTLQATGPFVFANLVPGVQVTFTQNRVDINGTITGNTIHLKGSGQAAGKICLDEGCLNFSCTGTSSAEFTR